MKHIIQNINKGNFIRDKFSKELDELRIISNDANQWMLDYQKTLREETKISSLKIGFNKVFFLDLRVSNISLRCS